MPIIDVSTLNQARAYKIYDPALSVNQTGDSNVSLVANRANAITINGMVGTQTVLVQIKIHTDDVWHTFSTVNTAVPTAVITFPTVFNFVRVTRAGAGNFIVFAQLEYAGVIV